MGTVRIRYVADPLHMREVEERLVESTGSALHCVRLAFPELDPEGLVIVRGVHPIPPDTLVSPGDILVCAYRPQAAGFVAAGFWKAVVTALVSAAISYLVAYVMRPKERKGKAASPAYSVNIDQNAARLGGTIPVIYGRVLALPDVAAQAYAEYISDNERVSMLLCLGMGEFQIHDILLGETRVSDFPPGNVTTWIFPPAAHGQVLGNIERVSGVCEDMFTIPETTGIDLAAPNDPAEITVAGTVNGGTLTPDGNAAATLWTGLVPGKKYIVTNSAGGTAVLTYVGVGANNSAVFDGPLPVPGNQQIVPVTAQLTPVTDSQEGDVMLLYATGNVPNVSIGEIIYVQHDTIRRGPYQIYKFTVGTSRVWLRKQGVGFQSADDTDVFPQKALWVLKNYFVTYSITEWTENTPTQADPYRWRGWFAANPNGVMVDTFYVDIIMPNGIAWVTDKGDYNNMSTTFRLQWQRCDIDGNPTGGIATNDMTISGSTSNPRRRTLKVVADGPGYFRVRVCRVNTRDQRASKEISKADLTAIRARVYHPPGTAAYENCTLLAMTFSAGSGLAGVSGRRIKVDCTRKIPQINLGTLEATTNPCHMVPDILENVDYGGARPWSETDRTALNNYAAQWATTNGFNGVFDQPTTIIEALQAVLAPVRALPVPIGMLMSVTQDAPRDRQYVFGPETVVQNSLSIGYNFDGVDQPDCLEVLYTDPRTFAEARIYYPFKGVNPETTELFGCTSQAHAQSWARLRWQETYYNRKTCQFELEGEGYLLQPLTRFGLVVPAVSWGTAGMTLFYDAATRELEVDTPIPADSQVIRLKGSDGKVSGAMGFLRVAGSDYRIRFLADPPWPPKGSDQFGDGTRWVVGKGMDQFLEFSVTDLSATSPMRVQVNGLQYTDAKYQGTFLETWRA